ncbi:MAG TPA: universal stress protein [Thermoleophilaceae bacterium]|nr:universal stress protein [Thermoleophilaceae bacterium]
MYRRIIAGHDGSEQGRDALALAEALRAPDGVVIAAHVVPCADNSEPALSEARDGQRPDWLEVRAVPGGPPARGLHDLSEQLASDLVVVGSSHHAVSGRVRAGRTAERLLHGSPCPVAVAPAGFATEGGPPRVIGVAYDGSDESKSALNEGARLAARFEAAMKVITVVPPVTAAETVREQRREAFRRTLQEAAGTLPVVARAAPILVTGRPAEVIADEAEKGIHVLVMGSRSYGPLHRVFAGSTAIELMRRAPCPVIVIPRGAAVPRRGAAASAAAAV